MPPAWLALLEPLVKWLVTPVVLQVISDLMAKRSVDVEFARKSDEAFGKVARAGTTQERREALAELHRLLNS